MNKDKPMTEMKPCPFCGSSPTTDKIWMTPVFFIQCPNEDCVAQPSVSVKPKCVENKGDTVTYAPLWDEAEIEAIKKWNTRYALQSAPVNEAMERQLFYFIEHKETHEWFYIKRDFKDGITTHEFVEELIDSWTKDPLEAFRFKTAEDAESYLTHLSNESVKSVSFITEHLFIHSTPAQPITPAWSDESEIKLTEATDTRTANEKIRLYKLMLQAKLELTCVPYIRAEMEHQESRLRELKLYHDGYTFEQNINSIIERVANLLSDRSQSEGR